MKCPRCGRDNAVGRTECEGCRAPLEDRASRTAITEHSPRPSARVDPSTPTHREGEAETHVHTVRTAGGSLAATSPSAGGISGGHLGHLVDRRADPRHGLRQPLRDRRHPRPGRHGPRLQGARPRGRQADRPQDDPARYRGGPRRARALQAGAGARAQGHAQERGPHLRPRRGGGDQVLHDGVHRGREPQGADPAPGPAPGEPGAAARAPDPGRARGGALAGHRAPRPEAAERHGRGGHGHGPPHGLRHRARHRRHQHDRDRRDRRHARLHVARAGEGRAAGDGVGRLLLRRDPLRDADRGAALPGGHPDVEGDDAALAPAALGARDPRPDPEVPRARRHALPRDRPGAALPARRARCSPTSSARASPPP